MAQSRKRRLERLEYDPLDPSKQHQPQTAGELVSSYVDKNLLAGASAASLALTTWRRVAGPPRGEAHGGGVAQRAQGKGLPSRPCRLP